MNSMPESTVKRENQLLKLKANLHMCAMYCVVLTHTNTLSITHTYILSTCAYTHTHTMHNKLSKQGHCLCKVVFSIFLWQRDMSVQTEKWECVNRVSISWLLRIMCLQSLLTLNEFYIKCSIASLFAA